MSTQEDAEFGRWKTWIETITRDLASLRANYNARRPHRGLALPAPETCADVDPVEDVPEIDRRDLFGG